MSAEGGARRSESRIPHVVVSFVLGIGALIGLWKVGMLAFAAGVRLDASSGLGPISDQVAARVFHEHREDCENLRTWLARDANVADPLRGRLPEGLRQDYMAALKRIGAFGLTRERFDPEGRGFAIHVGADGNLFRSYFVDFVWTDGPMPMDRMPVGDDSSYTRHRSLGGGWYLRWGTR